VGVVPDVAPIVTLDDDDIFHRHSMHLKKW
jgi:hypothetical protein